MNYTLEDIKKQSPYPIGKLNTAYAKYFVGIVISILLIIKK